MASRRHTAIFGFGLAALASAPLFAQQPPSDPPPGPGLELIQSSCVGCHDINMITSKRKTRDEWAATIGLMADRGAEVTPEEMQTIEDYLSKNFSKDAAEPALTK